jgi:hypothetical protein
MAIIAFNSFDPFEKTNCINSIVCEDEEIKVAWHAVDLKDFGVVLFNLFNGFVRVYLFAVNGSILVSRD